ncbi:formin homology 2 domain (FH2) protein [Cryptosporidium canis]|nr:formin homology 2 domain (FH2) protein [Cryptosporidium canis]
MISSLVTRILGGSGTGAISGLALGDDTYSNASEEHSIYCAASLSTFYRPKRLKIAIFDHIPCCLENLNIELFTIQRSGNFKEYIMSHIHDIKKSRVPRQTLIMNGYSFYCVISSNKIQNCPLCGNDECSSLVVDFTRNADNGESTYLIFQGEMILRIYDRKSGLNIYSLARGGSADDVIHITKNDIILSIPNSFTPSQCFKLDLIMYSAISWTRNGEVNHNLKLEKEYSSKSENVSQNRQFSVSSSQNLSICYEGEINKKDHGQVMTNDTKVLAENSKDNVVISNMEKCASSTFKTTGSHIESPEFIGSKNPGSDPNIKENSEHTHVSGLDNGSKQTNNRNSDFRPETSQLAALLRAKAPPLPLSNKAGVAPKAFPFKGIGKDSLAKSTGNKKKVLPLGRRIHWKPLSEEMAQKTIFREILYTTLNSHSHSSISPSESSNNSSPTTSIEDLYSGVANDQKVEAISSVSDSASPAAITDVNMANALVDMETLLRVFTKSCSTIGGQRGTSNSTTRGISGASEGTNDGVREGSDNILWQEGSNDQNSPNIGKSSDSLNKLKGPDENTDRETIKLQKDGQSSQSNISSQKQLPLTFLSQKRAQNMAIVLARLSVPTDYIIEVLRSFNISSLTLEDYERIEQVLPTEKELEKIKSNPNKELHQLEQFLSRFSHISNPMTRLRFLKFEHIIDASEFDIQRNLNTLYSASAQIRNSNKLRIILKAFLLLGNYVNHGINLSTMSNMSSISHVSNNGSVNWSLLETKGFSLSSLLRLVEFKTTIDPSFTALHYIIANLSLTNPKLNLGQLSGDLHAVSEASKISVEALFSYINDMRKELAILEVEKQKFTNDRVENLFESYSRRLDALIEGYHRIVEKVVDTALYFGQNLPEGNRASIIQPFFETMNIFILQFSSCCKEIREKPSRFFPLLVDSSLAFQNDKSLNSSLMYIPYKANSTETSSISSTPLIQDSPNTSLINIPDIPPSGVSEKIVKETLFENEVQSLDSNSKISPYKEPFSSIMNSKNKKDNVKPILIKNSNNNAIQLPTRPPPPKNLK